MRQQWQRLSVSTLSISVEMVHAVSKNLRSAMVSPIAMVAMMRNYVMQVSMLCIRQSHSHLLIIDYHSQWANIFEFHKEFRLMKIFFYFFPLFLYMLHMVVIIRWIFYFIRNAIKQHNTFSHFYFFIFYIIFIFSYLFLFFSFFIFFILFYFHVYCYFYFYFIFSICINKY